MKIVRYIGSPALVLGLFTAVFGGVPWHLLVADDPPVPWWLRIAIFWLLGRILLLLVARHTLLDKPECGPSLVAEALSL